MPVRHNRPLSLYMTGFVLAIGCTSAAPAAADIIITPRTGCPMFHCTPESTGVMYQPIIESVTRLTQNNTLGALKAQGCSGNGTILACLYASDTASNPAYQGTLKVLDAGSLTPLWGSASPTLTNGYNIGSTRRSAYSIGEVPYIFSNGQITAGDSAFQALYDGSSGNLATTVANPKLPLNTANGSNFGFTQLVNGLGISPEDNNYAVISQANGVFTLVQISSWTQMGAAVALTGLNNESVSLASPSSASGGTLYAVASNNTSRNGYLFSLRMDVNNKTLGKGAVFNYLNTTGSSPVVVKPAITGDAAGRNMILLHVPQLSTDTTPQDRLVSLWDNGTNFELNPNWPGDGTATGRIGTITLGDKLGVAPTIDEKNKIIYFTFTGNGATTLYAYDLIKGTPISTYPIQNVFANPPNSFKLNGHIVSIQNDAMPYTVLLSAAVPRGTASVAAGQYVIAYQPALAKALWLQKIADVSDSYTAAWSIGAPDTAGRFCPTVIGAGATSVGSGISLLCNH